VGEKPRVRHEAARVHHLARRRAGRDELSVFEDRGQQLDQVCEHRIEVALGARVQDNIAALVGSIPYGNQTVDSNVLNKLPNRQH